MPAATARLVEATRGWGGRVIAIGTTVVRALETVARADGARRGRGGLDRARRHARRAACGPSTACSPAGTSPRPRTCDMLEAIAGRALVERSYAAALQAGYLWHEFGDVHLILP